MEKEIFVSVRLPAADRSYEVKIPAGLNTHVATLLTARALESLSDGTFRAAKSCVLAWQHNGQTLNGKKTIAENGVINGSGLLLI